MFSPDRLSLARRRRGRTKKELAQALGVHQHTILRYESGETEPSPEGLVKLARLLDFPDAFFSGPALDEPSLEAASFRSMSSLAARERDAALAAGALAFAVDDWVRQRFELPATDLLDFSGEEPEAAARSLREVWGLGERPIRNMVHLLEAKGIRVFSLAENTRTVDAFSVWRGGSPYVFLNTIKTAEHSRMDAAHELGHLALHRHGGPGGREGEFQAQKFASAFLMPAADVLAILPHAFGIEQLIRHKKRWGVSVAALNYRLHKLRVLSDWQYRDICIQISQRGYRTSEPEGRPREMSAIWQKVLDALRREGVCKHAMADALSLPVAEMEKLLFMLAPMLSLEGSAASTGGRSTAKLSLVGGTEI